MDQASKNDILEVLYKGLNNLQIKEFSNKGFIYNELIRKGYIQAIHDIENIKSQQ